MSPSERWRGKLVTFLRTRSRYICRWWRVSQLTCWLHLSSL